MKPYSRLKSVLLVTVLSGAAGFTLLAQDATPAPTPPPGPRPPMDHGHPPHRPPPPLMEALDINHDGILSADEIANASASLKKLDKNGDGQLTEDELRPPPPPGGQHGPPPPRGPRGPGDQSAITPGQQGGPGGEDRREEAALAHSHRPHRDFGAGGLPPDDRPPTPPQGPLSSTSVPRVPAAASAQRQPPRLHDDPVAAHFEQATPKVD